MQQFTLTLDQRRLDYIINVLAQRPYAEVMEVLQDIGAQVAQQRAAASLQPPPPGLDAAPSKPNGHAAQHGDAP